MPLSSTMSLLKENVTQTIEREQAQEETGLEEIAKSTEVKIEKLTEEIDSENLDKTEKSARKQLRRKLKKIARKLHKDYNFKSLQIRAIREDFPRQKQPFQNRPRRDLYAYERRSHAQRTTKAGL